MDLDSQQIVTTVSNSGSIGALAATGGIAINTIQLHYVGFAPEMLHKPIETVLEQFRQGNREVAKGQLKILRELGGQDPKILPSLDVVSIYLNLLDSDETTKIRQQLTAFLANSIHGTPSLLDDLCVAALIRLQIKDTGPEAVRAFWNTLKSPGIHAKEAFYTLAATTEELEELITLRGFLLSVTELRGVVEGAIRLHQYQLADEAVNHLLKVDKGPATSFLQLSITACLIESKIENRQFWSVTATVHDSLIQLAEDAAKLLLSEPLPDPRLPLLAARLFMYLRGFSKALASACWEKIDLIEKVHLECAAQLRFQQENVITGLNEIAQKFVKAEKDVAYRKQCVNDLVSGSTISREDAMFLALHAKPGELKTWLGNGGVCSDEDDITRDLITLHLHSRSLHSAKDRDAVRKLKDRCNSFLICNVDKLASLNADPIIDLACHLTALGLQTEACNFIEALLPTGDYWLNPLLRCYIDTLISADKNATLATVLHEIPERLWDRAIWQMKARLEFMVGNYTEAKQALEKGAVFGFTTQLAMGLINVLKKMGKEAEVSDVISKVHDNALSQGDALTQQLIVEMFKNGLHERAERLMLDWFIASPESSALVVTDICNSLITLDTPVAFGLSTPQLIKGVKYFDGKTYSTKLIVPPEQAQGQYLLSSESPLGGRLLNAAIGENFKEGIATYKMEEHLPPMVAAYQISLHIRDNMNQGNDAFHMFNVSDDPHEMIIQLQDMMATGKEHKNLILEHELLPIMFKGKMLNRSNPFDSALGLLSDSNAIKHLLPTSDYEEDMDIVLLDVYSVAYLTITGLVSGLIAAKIRICISIETNTCIQKWLSGRHRDDGGMLTTQANGMPLLLTTEDIRLKTKYIAEQAQLLLTVVDVASPDLCDLHPELLDLRDCVDSSVFSTLRIASTRKIPWLCIDTNMSFLANSISCPVVNNCLSLLTRFSTLTLFEDRKYGLYRHAFDKLHFPLRYHDLSDLSIDEEDGSVLVLSMLVRQYPNAFPNAEQTAQAMADLFLPVLTRALLGGEFEGIKRIDDVKFPRNVMKLANACFYVATHSGKEHKAEYNFALYVYRIIIRAVPRLGVDMSQRLINVTLALGTAFLRGHFMSTVAVKQHLEKLLDTPMDSLNL